MNTAEKPRFRFEKQAPHIFLYPGKRAEIIPLWTSRTPLDNDTQ
jgi:hypothetical protein